MNKFILIRYSELTLKGRNKKHFSNILGQTLKRRLNEKELDYTIKVEYDLIRIVPNDKIEDYLPIVKNTIGISWFTVATETTLEEDEMAKAILESIDPSSKTFRVSAKASNKDIWESSQDLTTFVAKVVLQNTDLTVNLDNYDVEVNVNVKKDVAIIYSSKIQGISGLPAGSNGRALSLLSGGIDSPIASHLMQRRGLDVMFVTYLNPVTATEDTVHKITELAKLVNKFNSRNSKLLIVNFELIMKQIMEHSKTSYRLIMLRTFMMKFSEALSERYNLDILITGDSLGQVSSQTSKALTIVDNASPMFIARPLVGLDKIEIIAKAKEIGAYDLSILPGNDMCSNFTPTNVAINPRADEAIESFKNIMGSIEDYDQLVEDMIENHITVVEL